MSELAKTPLYEQHQALDARIVDFGGWALPVNYGSQVDEHHAVRTRAGMFDVSHMTVSDVTGRDVIPCLRFLLSNDIDKASKTPGKAIYSCLLNDSGGVIDDLIVYRMTDQHCRLITNAATNAKDMAWIKQQSSAFEVEFQEKPELAILAVQGPSAIKQATSLAPLLSQNDQELIASLQRFQGATLIDMPDIFVGRTGYTGEDGLEFVLPADAARQLWEAFLTNGVQPCGLGARDTLRLEAGMSLYGNDLDESHTPAESGIAWAVALSDERNFIGKQALHSAPRFQMIGLVLLDRGVLRGHQAVFVNDIEIGEITSGTFSPTLQQSIALARVSIDSNIQEGDQLQIKVRAKTLNAQAVSYPFVKNGKASFNL